MIVNLFASRPNHVFTHSMSRSTRAFSLFEALCMIVTLCVFGWLCAGVIRTELKGGGKSDHDKFMTGTAKGAAAKQETPPPPPAAAKPAPEGKPSAPWKDLVPAASQPAGSRAPIPIPSKH